MSFEHYQDIFEPYKELVEIEVLGERYEVPENNTLLRCFQFLSMETVSRGEFCWNGDCANCQVWLESTENAKPALACRTKVFAEMKIVRTSREIEIVVNGK